MNEPSDEQLFVINQLKNNKNVIVDAIAGSGKSTTILSVAKAFIGCNILQMTYNSMLRLEIKEKTKVLQIENIEVHTFHSLAKKYYLLSAHTDTAIRYILFNQIKPRISIPIFKLIVLDETQDMSFLYYQLMIKFSKDMGSNFQLLILGDYKQGLYEFKGADTRFLTMADQIWNIHPQLSNKEFVRCNLKMSYRITKQMAHFVNNVMLGEQRMYSCKDGEPVYYYRQSRRNTEIFVIAQIKKLLEMGAKPSDFFVLCASVKGHNSYIRKMENALVENDIPCHVPMLETENVDEKVIEGKVVFSTFHSVKGRQRKYVFIVGFDNSYYFKAKNASKEICPNTLYVGATRATDYLYLLEKNDFDTDRPLEFLKMSHHQMKLEPYIAFKGTPQSLFYERNLEAEQKSLIPRFNITPTNLITFVPENVIEDISPLIDRIFIRQTGEPTEADEIELPTVCKTRKGFYEDVSDINGVAVPCIYYHHIQKRWKTGELEPNILKKMIENNMADSKDHEHRFLKDIIQHMPDKCTKISDYLYAANIYIASQERLYFKLKQIEPDEYTWITRENAIKCIKRLDTHVLQECKRKIPIFEKVLIDYSMDKEHEDIDAILSPHFDNKTIFRFSARVDLVTENTLWELKCTSKITIDHLLQVVIYAWLWKILVNDDRNIRILNIKTGEVLQLQATMDELTFIVVSLLKGKYCDPVVKSDEEFVQDCRNMFSHSI
jgi:hypothetical protein